MNKLMLNSHAKVNLLLDVIGKREDGYHDVKMIMQQCGLCDTIMLETIESGIALTTNLVFLPTDERNIAYKAARCFFDHTGISGGVKIDIAKHIPVAAGLAGGSGNAAAVLLGLNTLYNANLPLAELLELGKSLGADVPYCMLGSTMLSEGIGDILSPLAPLPRTPIVLVKPPISVSTAVVYKEIGSSQYKHPNTDLMIDAIKRQDIRGIAASMENVMESVTISKHPVIRDIKNSLLESGALGAIMSGSGPTVFGLFEDYNTAKAASLCFNKWNFFVYAGWTQLSQ